MHNRMDSDPSTSNCTSNTTHDVRNHNSKKGRTRKRQKWLNKRCSGDSSSRMNILIAKETLPSSSSQLCLLAKGNIEVRGEPSNDSQVAIVMMMLCINLLWITFALLTLCLTRIVIKSRTYLKQMFPLPLNLTSLMRVMKN